MDLILEDISNSLFCDVFSAPNKIGKADSKVFKFNFKHGEFMYTALGAVHKCLHFSLMR